MNFDFESLTNALELAGDAGAATGQIAKGLETVKALFKSSEDGTDADVKLVLSELTAQIANAQMANSDWKFKLTALQDELAKAQAFQSDLDRYALWETPTGAIVYRLREEAQENQPLHYLCPACVEDKRKSILQGHKNWRKCTVCAAEFRFDPRTSRAVTTVRRSRWRDV